MKAFRVEMLMWLFNFICPFFYFSCHCGDDDIECDGYGFKSKLLFEKVFKLF